MAELPIATQCGTGAPAPLPWIPAPYRGTGHAFDRGNNESEDLFSYQSLMPVATGTPRYEKLGALVDGRVRCRLCHAPRP